MVLASLCTGGLTNLCHYYCLSCTRMSLVYRASMFPVLEIRNGEHLVLTSLRGTFDFIFTVITGFIKFVVVCALFTIVLRSHSEWW